uniref:ENSANGG00000019048-like protein n=1 Tax=Oikopleura dioica TaxID=34765 RepID=Q676B9_OIKDI|nr:ENSANGG00000019048-like protein [Oikopleura dioica]
MLKDTVSKSPYGDEKNQEKIEKINRRRSQEDLEEIILLFLGPRLAGKTTIKERIFDGLQPTQIIYVEQTIEVRVDTQMNAFAKMKIVDFPGMKDLSEVPQDTWHLPASENGLDIGDNTAKLAVIYVIDSQDGQSYRNALTDLYKSAELLKNYNKNLTFDIFMHKSDGLNEEELNAIHDDTLSYIENINDVGIQISTTSAMDQTIFDAMSKVIQKRIPEQAQLEKWLNLMINNANVAKAYLMDVRTKLFIATDSSPAENTQLSIYEICSGMIEMGRHRTNQKGDLVVVGSCFEGNIRPNSVWQTRHYEATLEIGGRCRPYDSDEDIMPAFDENHESWVTMKEEIVLCLYGITSNLALVCVVREDALNQRGIMMYNLNLFRQTIRKTLEQSRT